MFNLNKTNNKLIWSKDGRKIIVESNGDFYNITDDSGISTYVNTTTVSKLYGSYFILCMLDSDYDIIHRTWNSGGREYREYVARKYFEDLAQTP